jgi:hypothetical protein
MTWGHMLSSFQQQLVDLLVVLISRTTVYDLQDMHNSGAQRYDIAAEDSYSYPIQCGRQYQLRTVVRSYISLDLLPRSLIITVHLQALMITTDGRTHCF